MPAILALADYFGAFNDGPSSDGGAEAGGAGGVSSAGG
jgi:hypothetical protein